MRNLIFALFLLVVSACVNEKESSITQAETTWVFDVENADTLLRHHIDTVSYLLLEEQENTMLFDVDKFIAKNGLLYLADFRTQKIVVYDKKGNLKFVLANRGNGPEEYLEMKSFAVDSSSIYVIDNYRHKILVYNGYNGVYERTLNLPFVAWDMEILPDGYFIFTYIPYRNGRPNMQQDPYKIFITDKEMRIKRKMFEYAEGQFDFVGRKKYFMPSQQGIVFTSASSDDLYLFVGKDSMRQIAIEFPNRIPRKFRQNLDKIDKGNYNYLAQTPIWHKNYIISMLSQSDFLYDYVYDIPSGRLSKNDYYNAYKGLLTPIGSDGEHLYSYLCDYLVYQELVEHGFTRADEETENLLKHDGAVLVVYTMR